MLSPDLLAFTWGKEASAFQSGLMVLPMVFGSPLLSSHTAIFLNTILAHLILS